MDTNNKVKPVMEKAAPTKSIFAKMDLVDFPWLRKYDSGK
jgi:hypothetical protein